MSEACKWKSRFDIGRVGVVGVVGVRRVAVRSAVLCFASGIVTTQALAVPVQDYDFDWATIGAVGNGGLDRGPFTGNYGRGAVDYRYRISKLETTTAQWMEYVNTFSTQGDEYASFGAPLFWGAQADPTYNGPGRRWRLRSVADAERLPVAGLTWRESAQYVNWLHNGKQSGFDSLVTGAYDSTTWGGNVRDGFTDEERRLPGAKFWIPTMDEWMKAVYYDQNKNGAGDGGWWIYPDGSDTALISGFPDEGGETSGGIDTTGFPEEWNIPLGAYEDVVTPWGLWDASGGAMEYLEDFSTLGTLNVARRNMGSWAGDQGYWFIDQAGGFGSTPPDDWYPYTGFRIVSAIPSPGTNVIVYSLLLGSICRRRRLG